MVNSMSSEVIITCAITGAGDTLEKNPAVPVTPAEIAESTIAAARAGATVAHIHVRDPATGKGSREPALYREVVDRIRSSEVDIVLNLTAGMGGDLFLGPDDEPTSFSDDTDLVGSSERLVHIEELRPEICTLDCGSLNFGDDNLVYVSSPAMLRSGARRVQELGVKPELEIFDSGNLAFAKQLLQEGLLDSPPLFQLCLGIPWGAPADTTTMKALVDSLPAGAEWAAFGIGKQQFPMAAQAAILGGHIRVGLEDNLYLKKGELATNEQLVAKAVDLLDHLGVQPLSPEGARSRLNLTKAA